MPESVQTIFESALARVPPVLQPVVNRYWQDFQSSLAFMSLLGQEMHGPADPDHPADPDLPVETGHSVPSSNWLTTLPMVWACSEYVAHTCLNHPRILCNLVSSGDLYRPYAPGEMAERVGRGLQWMPSAPDHPVDLDQPVVPDHSAEESLKVRLRQLRRQELLRIAWRDLAGWAELPEVVGDLSAFADACVDQALDRLYTRAVARHGMPLGEESGEGVSLIVLGLGKLGGRELNFSSDIDLIFAYSEEGRTDFSGSSGRSGSSGGLRPISNHEFFLDVGRRLIAVLNEMTADGMVFRVDMRLRPNGASGPLALGFDAMEEYYQAHGRDWERYAMIKARQVAGDREQGARLLHLLRPFVYRRYLDFNAIASLREMKARIQREVNRRGMKDNIKLGHGGIREVEFIGQLFQLVRGGREVQLQERGIQLILECLAKRGHVPQLCADELNAAYVFLRRLENRLQAFADQQTHVLPADDSGRIRLAFSMGYQDWAAFARELAGHRQRVTTHFERIFAAAPDDPDHPVASVQPGDLPGDDGSGDLVALWTALTEISEVDDRIIRSDRVTRSDRIIHLKPLTTAGFDDATEAYRILVRLREGYAYRSMSALARERMDRLMPKILRAAGSTGCPELCLQRLVALLEAVARRSAYLSLLLESPAALSQLVKLCAASKWIAELITRHPLLLDDLLDARTLYEPLDRARLELELEDRLQMVLNDGAEHPGVRDHPVEPVVPDDPERLERHMEILRNFKQSNVLRVAAADITGVLPLQVVSGYLSEIAEVVLNKVLALAWVHVVEQYGEPSAPDHPAAPEQSDHPGCKVGGGGSRLPRCNRSNSVGFAIVAYGKLGGIELGYGSDLDLVFLYGSTDEQQQMVPGANSIDNTQSVPVQPDHPVFIRLCQRIIHILNTYTPAGVLYPVDTRLRPNGRSGLLVSSVEAFADYQRHRAWTWEHQALVRARVVAGDPDIARQFAAIRREIITRKRDAEVLREEVSAMRTRMYDEFAVRSSRLLRNSRSMDRFDLKQGRGGIADIEFMVQYWVLLWSRDHPELLRFTDNIHFLEGLVQAGLVAADDGRLLSDAYRSYRARVHRVTLQGRADALGAPDHPVALEHPNLVDNGEFQEYRAEVSRIWRKWMVG